MIHFKLQISGDEPAAGPIYPGWLLRGRRDQHLVWVFRGELVFIEGETTHHMDEGDCFELAPPNDCTFANETADECRYAVIVLRQA
ncbi:hypothetical protein [Rhizobium etli]|uniref:hypothetical protein n=1 Tax=Rhizobium etli TaxID=29449 RepID=UPI0018AD54DC|nr:hypothetical protein [Rhizobium etli]